MPIIQIDQNTPEWDELRRERITASNFDKIMSGSINGTHFNPNAAFSDTAHDYAMRKAIQITTNQVLESYKSRDMEKGHIYEPLAREAYEIETFSKVLLGGVSYNNKYLASSDGLVEGEKGGVEIKSVKYNTHFKRLKRGGYDTKYKWQIVGNIWMYKLKWIDFVQYCHEFPESKQLYTYRVDKNTDEIEMLIKRLTVFNQLVDSYVKIAS